MRRKILKEQYDYDVLRREKWRENDEMKKMSKSRARKKRKKAYEMRCILCVTAFLLVVMLPVMARADDASYSTTISLPERKVEQKSHQINITFSIEGFGALSESLIVVTSDYPLLRLDTYTFKIVWLTPEGPTVVADISPPVNERTLTSWADMYIGGRLLSDYQQIILGSITIEIEEKIPLGDHKVKVALIGKTNGNKYIFSDEVELKVLDMWEANPVLLPILTFVLGLVSGLVLLLVGLAIDRRWGRKG
jgi:hypothetical protein